MRYMDDADSAPLPPSSEAASPGDQDWACGPFGFWPALAFPPGGGVSWGHESPWRDYRDKEGGP